VQFEPIGIGVGTILSAVHHRSLNFDFSIGNCARGTHVPRTTTSFYLISLSSSVQAGHPAITPLQLWRGSFINGADCVYRMLAFARMTREGLWLLLFFHRDRIQVGECRQRTPARLSPLDPFDAERIPFG
jgi:hypothetical protein